MKQLLTKISLSLALMAGLLGGPILVAETVAAAQPATQVADTVSEIKKGVNSAGGGGQPKLVPTFKKIINVLLFIIGLIAVLMIIIGGLRYVVSGGDSSATKGAKDTILYAVIGLIVAIMAYGIINFVVTKF
ncbi:MAG TPA: hypothetical protein VFK03_04355 [Candidatus Saccharimonadales bacterium]|nr:hypothetical protein [Candidatus Saccharimonadales bacterium]